MSSVEKLNNLLINSGASKSLLSALLIPASLNDVFDSELFALTNKSKTKGVIIFKPNTDYYSYVYRLTRPKSNKTGRIKPVVCDFCYTWLTPGSSGLITFDRRKNISNTYYCCIKLNCSKNVRDLTYESKLSRTQLVENITIDNQISRLSRNITKIISVINE